MSVLTIVRVNQLPNPLAGNTIYITKADAADIAQIHFTNNDGSEVRHLLGLEEVYSIAQSQVQANSLFYVAPTLTGMLGLSPQKTAMIYVIDASTAENQNAGAAWYLYDAQTSTHTKLNVGSANWGDVQGRPQSGVDAIDAAVQNSHAHANLSVLDRFSQNENGAVCFDGKPIVTYGAMEW